MKHASKMRLYFIHYRPSNSYAIYFVIDCENKIGANEKFNKTINILKIRSEKLLSN